LRAYAVSFVNVLFSISDFPRMNLPPPTRHECGTITPVL
jgi:hypothetical protein